MAVRRRRFSTHSRKLFRQLRAETEGTSRWWELQGDLHEELGLKPWEWPAVVHPGAETKPDPGSFAEQCDDKAKALYAVLDRYP